MWLFAVCAVMAEDDVGLLIFNHQIAIGMTFGNVQAAWGKPDKVDRSVSSNGVREYWFFDKGWMVVFQNGRVVSFHQF
jgi:hypothetical protein